MCAKRARGGNSMLSSMAWFVAEKRRRGERVIGDSQQTGRQQSLSQSIPQSVAQRHAYDEAK